MEDESAIKRRVAVSLTILFLLVFVIGPIGYMLIEDMSFTDAFYMTVITIFTVGFGLVKSPMSTAGIYFTIFLIFFGVFILFFLISAVINFTFREVLGDTLGRRKMARRIDELEGHNVICGYGRVGQVVCNTLSQGGADFVVVEINQDLIEEAKDRGFFFVKGDAMKTETLEKAGVERAQGLVCALQDDADNLYTTLTARSLNPDLTIVTRCVGPDSVEKLRFAGADRVISPYMVSGKRMANFLLKPGVFELMDTVYHGESLEYNVEELLVGKGAAIDGHTIGDAEIKARTGALVMAVRESGSGDFNTNPHKDTVIHGGDLLIAIGTDEDLAGLEELAAKPG